MSHPQGAQKPVPVYTKKSEIGWPRLWLLGFLWKLILNAADNMRLSSQSGLQPAQQAFLKNLTCTDVQKISKILKYWAANYLPFFLHLHKKGYVDQFS